MSAGPLSFPLAAGTPVTVDLAAKNLQRPCEAELQNESPLTLTITIQGQTYSLGAWKANKYQLWGANAIRVDPVQIQSPVPANVPSSSLIVTVWDTGEPCPVGVWPYDLGRMTAIQAGTVNISGTPNVIITSGTVNIGNTPTVILGAGTASVGTIAGITGTVTVAGTINIGNTPSVSISGTPSVNIASGSVSITGTPNINIQSQSVNVATVLPQTSLGNFSVALNSTNSATYTPPANTHAIGILVSNANSGLTNLLVKGVTTGLIYGQFFNQATYLQGYFVVPVLQALDSQVTVQGSTDTGSGPTTVYSVALTAHEGVYVFNNQRAPLTVQIQAFGASASSAPAAGTKATVTLSALAGRSWFAVALGASIEAAGAAGASDVQLLDGAGVGAVLYELMLGVINNAGQTDRLAISDLSIQGTPGNAMTWQFNSGQANCNERVTFGAYSSL